MSSFRVAESYCKKHTTSRGSITKKYCIEHNSEGFLVQMLILKQGNTRGGSGDSESSSMLGRLRDKRCHPREEWRQ